MPLICIRVSRQAVGAVIGGVTMVVLFIGWQASLAGIGSMVLILAINFVITGFIGSVEKRNLILAGNRISILSEIVRSIKAVKFFA